MTETKWYSGPIYVLVTLALVLGFSLVPATTSMVSAQGATGTFLTGNVPTVTIVYAPASVTPQTNMTVSVVVNNSDRNLTELSNMTFQFWYDANGGNPSLGEFNASPNTAQEGIGIPWDSVGGFGNLSPVNTTWVQLTCTAPADMNVTEGTFWFNFTIGKVAKKTSGLAVWQIAATANDTTYGMGFGYDATPGVTMNFYSAVSISPPGPTVDWGLVPPGLAFAEDGNSEEALGANVIYIVNGNYTQNVASSANWTNLTAANATLDDTGTCGSAQQFSLKADDTGTLPAGNLVTTGTGVAIKNGTITGDGTAGGGAGNVEAANTLWLMLADTFATAEYTGTLTYSVAEV
jgi:hypothetical protein